MNIITRAEAKAAGLKKYFINTPCPNGHVSERFVSGGQCVECNLDRRIKHYEKNRDRELSAVKAWQDENRERNLSQKREYRLANLSKERERKRLHMLRYNKREELAAHRAARRAVYRASKVNASPSWLTDEMNAEIRRKYAIAQLFTRETGIPHHVDHRMPLRGDTVCGLHVPWNLRVVPALLNLKKGNRWQHG